MIYGIELYNFRKFTNFTAHNFQKLNIFYGQNGSGKTSILESIATLLNGTSFRTGNLKSLIKNGNNRCYVNGFIKHSSNDLKKMHMVIDKYSYNRWLDNYQKQINKKTMLKSFPVCTIGPNSLSLFIDGPDERRKFLNWCCFYSEPEYGKVWNIYNRIIKHRNCLLKYSKFPINYDKIRFWDIKLIDVNSKLSELRSRYIKQSLPKIQYYLNKIFPSMELSINLYKGWDQNIPYEKILEDNLSKEIILGYTNYGSHKADLEFYINNEPLKHYLSRGELKLTLLIVVLYNLIFLKDTIKTKPILLLDDIFSELDNKYSSIAAEQIINSDIITFISTLPGDYEILKVDLLDNINYCEFNMDDYNV